MRRREAASTGEAQEGPSNSKDNGAASSQDEATRAKSAAAAAAKKHAEARRGLSGFLRNLGKLYRRADDVVNMPFLIVFTTVLFAIVFFGSKPRPKKISYGLAPDVGEGESKEWRWVQSQGKDVVGKVNCTTYLHAASETLVELGHGSGGGLAFKIGEKGKVKYVLILMQNKRCYLHRER